jgi:glycosyltransferase involved in cell wall biosynthesis
VAAIGRTLQLFVEPLAAYLRQSGMETIAVSGAMVPLNGFDRTYELTDFRRQPPQHLARALQELIAVIRRERPTLLHLHSPAAIVIGRIAGLLTRTPTITSTHGTLLDANGLVGPVSAVIEAATARLSRVTLTENEADAEFYRRFTPRGSVLLAPVGGLGVDDRALSEATSVNRRTNQSPAIVSVGRLTPDKNLDLVVAAFQRVRKQFPKATLTFVGDALPGESIWRPPKLEGIEHIGWLDNPYEQMARSDVLVSASRREGFGLVVAEALLLGTPVVAVRNRGTVQVMRQKPNGLVLTRDDPDEIGAAVLEAWTRGRVRNDELRGTWSRQNAINFHSTVIADTVFEVQAHAQPAVEHGEHTKDS